MSFAENLKNTLDAKDVQVKELSAKTGISKNTIDNYLSGQKSLPNAENAVKIAQVLETSVEYLVTGKSSPSTAIPNSLLQTVHNLEKLTPSDFILIDKLIKSLGEKN